MSIPTPETCRLNAASRIRLADEALQHQHYDQATSLATVGRAWLDLARDQEARMNSEDHGDVGAGRRVVSDLTAFRDHARAMSTAVHKGDCPLSPLAREYRHRCGPFCTHPKPHCPGCVTDADRALWVRLADEADNYLSRNAEEGLFT